MYVLYIVQKKIFYSHNISQEKLLLDKIFTAMSSPDLDKRKQIK